MIFVYRKQQTALVANVTQLWGTLVVWNVDKEWLKHQTWYKYRNKQLKWDMKLFLLTVALHVLLLFVEVEKKEVQQYNLF